MKQIIANFLLLGVLLFLLSGCILPPKAEFRPPEGFAFSNYKAPLLLDFGDIKTSDHRGDASSSAFHEILFTGMSFAWGDCSIDTAVKDGRLAHVGPVDYEYLSFFRIFGKTTVHVYEAPQPEK